MSDSGRSDERGHLSFDVLALVLGLLLYLTLFVIPMRNWCEMRSWSATECTIRNSRLAKNDDGDRIEVEYSYQVSGQRYVSRRYSYWLWGDHQDVDAKRARVKSLAPGTRVECYYDPQAPSRAVIDRHFDLRRVLEAQIALLFLLLGAAGLVETILGRKEDKEEVAAKSDRVRLRTRRSRTLRVLAAGALLVAALGLARSVWTDVWHLGELTTSLVRTGAVALVMISAGWFGYQLLRVLAPRLRVELLGPSLRPGEIVYSVARLSGLPWLVRELRITIEGREEVGTHSLRSSSCTFFEQLLAERAGVAARTVRIGLELPRGSMHSFHGKHHRVIWLIVVRANVAWWPDIHEELEIEVLPEHIARTESPNQEVSA